MNYLTLLNELAANGAVICPVEGAAKLCEVAVALGLRACGGALIEDEYPNLKQVIYID